MTLWESKSSCGDALSGQILYTATGGVSNFINLGLHTKVTTEPYGDGRVQKSFIDILYDHRRFLDDHHGFLGPASAGAICSNKKVAIIGAGAAGLASSWLLMKMGLKADIYEADESRIGGRIWTHRCDGDQNALFEMGSMRVPPSERVFNYFARLYNIPSEPFPDPGVSDTQLQQNGVIYNWKAKQDVPKLFRQVSEDWHSLVNLKMRPVSSCLKDGRFDEARDRWQELLTGEATNWSNTSFFSALKRHFPHWNSTQFNLFGTLGIGTGGYGAMYTINFAEIARVIINGLEDSQQFYPEGMDGLIDGLYSKATKIHNCLPHALKDWSRVFLNQPVKSVAGTPDGTVRIDSINPEGGVSTDFYHAVIVTTSSRSMQLNLGLTASGGTPLLNRNQVMAIQNIHIINSSKFFLRTRTKFWKDSYWQTAGHPKNIQTDGLCRAVYCLDYPHTDSGVVLLSYTWGDDSARQMTMDTETREDALLSSLEPTFPEFVNKLREEAVERKSVDWQLEPNHFGAFKMNHPGQDIESQRLYSQFLSVKESETDKGIYLAGDDVSWSGGWIEGALQTAINASSAVIARLAGEEALYPNNPLTQRADLFHYGM